MYNKESKTSHPKGPHSISPSRWYKFNFKLASSSPSVFFLVTYASVFFKIYTDFFTMYVFFPDLSKIIWVSGYLKIIVKYVVNVPLLRKRFIIFIKLQTL
jgi:hypothetical protein